MDTNCNPQNIDYVIPSNDDAIRAIKLLVAKVADAVLEGKAMRKEEEGAEEKPEQKHKPDLTKPPVAIPQAVVEADEDVKDDVLLGESTLAKIERQPRG